MAHEHQQVEREMAIGVAAGSSGEITGTRRPAEGIDGRKGGIEGGPETGRWRDSVGHPNDETLVRVDVLELVPVEVRETQERGGHQQCEKRKAKEVKSGAPHVQRLAFRSHRDVR